MVVRKQSKRRAGTRPRGAKTAPDHSPPASNRPRSARPSAKAGGAYHHGDLRQALLDAAYAQVDAEGADSLSLAGLAKSLGVSQPAPYRHFADRGALLAAVATQ